MAYFPLFVSLEGKRCLVVGGGKVAFRKAKAMAEYGAEVVVVAEKFCEEMLELLKEREEVGLEGKQIRGEGSACGEGMKRIKGVWRRAAVEDAEGMDLVLCASSDEVFHHKMARYCQGKKIPVNVADNKEESSFLFPALVRQGDLVIGITTGGNSPAASRYLREKIGNELFGAMGKLVEELGKLRPLVKEKVQEPKIREEVFSRLFVWGLERNGEIKEEDVWKVIEAMKKQDESEY